MNIQDGAVKELYNLYSKDILHYSMSLLKNYDDAQDALQEVFIRYIDSRNSFRGDCSHKTYLLVITRNYCYKKMSGKSRNGVPIDNELAARSESSLDEKITLNEAIKKLSKEEFELIYLREYACHSYQEISEILDISIDNVKVRLFRVRDKLRKYLK